MKKFLLYILLIIAIAGLSQTGDTIKKQAGSGLTAEDSILERSKRIYDSIEKARAHAEQQESIARNLNSLLQLQKENRAKQKRAAMIRIAIGLGFLAVLIIGLRRRKKQGSRS